MEGRRCRDKSDDEGGGSGSGRAEEDDSWAEWERYRRLVCQHAPAVLSMLLDAFAACHYLQAQYLTRLISDSNYLLLALKYLNQDAQLLLRLPPSVSTSTLHVMHVLRVLRVCVSCVPSDACKSVTCEREQVARA